MSISFVKLKRNQPLYNIVKMKRLTIGIFGLITILLVSACSDILGTNYREISWMDLRPDNDASADQYSSLEIIDNRNTGSTSQVDVVSEMDGEKVRVSGFIVPVEFEAANIVTEFFLVPYFGACFHEPPPPPNQTIYVTSEKPIEFQSIYDPVKVSGVIKIEQTDNDIASAAYNMDFHLLEEFNE